MDSLDAKVPEPEKATGWTAARIAFLVIGLGLWAASVVEHDAVGLIFGKYFEYGKNNWGPNGRQIAEQGLFLAIGLGALVLAGVVLVKLLLSAAGRRALPEVVVRWATALLFCLAANRFLICIQSENVHFAQFAIFAFLLGLATRNPRWAFMITVFLGFLDELHQWWVIYWGEINQHLDWPDMCLDACGAALGALPFTTLARVKGHTAGTAEADPVATSSERLQLVVGALLFAGFLAALLLGTQLGHYPEQRPWEMLDNRKPFHTFGPREGVPAVIAVTLLLYFVVDERRKRIPLCVLLAVLGLWHVGLRLPKNEGEPIHEKVPQVKVPRAKGPVTIDGKLDPAEWAGALEVELHGYAPNMAEQFESSRGARLRENAKPTLGAELETKARLLWDDRALYVSFQCATQDAWARDFARDDAAIASSPCVEVFLDVDCAERAYYEFEVTAANRVQDLYVYWPVPPQWIPNPVLGEEFIGLPGWDSKHLETAVSVDGELDLLAVGVPAEARTKPPTKGYAVEIAIPWADLKGRAVGLEQQPKPGARFRANLFRVEPRRPPSEPATFMCWSPVHAPLTFHRPQFAGLLTLGE